MNEPSVDTVIVTRHQGLVQHLIAIGLMQAEDAVITQATPADITGKRVIGVLPLHLAALADSVVVIPLDLPAELRGVELSAEQVAQYCDTPTEYVVRLK